ncbi:MAG: hypothetical protein M3P98_04570 [bacterium]|nr:hypothetical protein [bacterium]
MTTAEQGELFPNPNPNKSRLDQYSEQKYPVLKVLGVPYGKFSGFKCPYARITSQEGAGIHLTGSGWSSQWTDEYMDEEDNLIGWANEPKTCGQQHEGFIQAITSFRETKKPMLHLLQNVTDITRSSAILLDDIVKVETYPENAARVMAMYQNAQEDGGIYRRENGIIVELLLSFEQIVSYVTEFWPEPTQVYPSDGSGNLVAKAMTSL